MIAATAAQQAEQVRNGLVVIAGIITSLGVIGVVLKKPLRWLWHRNVSEPGWQKFDQRLDNWAERTVTPQIDGVKAAARAQHEEQNLRIDGIGARLDEAAALLAAQAEQIVAIDQRSVTHTTITKTQGDGNGTG